MKTLILILSALFLTSCSNPDTSGGVTLSRGGDDGNEFPYGSCEGQGVNEDSGERTGCGWISAHGKSHYIMPGADLSDAPLWSVKLQHANLSGADLNGAQLQDADLRYANLEDADLRDADLYIVDLRDADLRDATLNYSNLYEADLRDADLRGAYLNNVRGWGANLRGAKLNDANLRGAYLANNKTHHGSKDAYLSGADLSGATLRFAELSQATLKDVKANSRTICPNGKKWGTAGNNCGFYENDDEFPHGYCEVSSYDAPSDSKNTGCGWIYAHGKTHYIKPYWKQYCCTNMMGANLRGVNLNNANLRFAVLHDVNLSGADLSGANLSGADLTWSDLTNATLKGVKANSSTICPNGKKWGTAGNNCGF